MEWLTAPVVLLAVLLTGIVTAVLVATLTGRGARQRALQDLHDHGHVVTIARQRNRGEITWVWGRFEQPLPLYLHLSNRDPLAVAAGHSGLGHLKIGHVMFDARFFLRTNQPEAARRLLTPQWCDRLARVESLEFIVTSAANLMSPDLQPDPARRQLRDIWMLRTDGRPDAQQLAPLVELAKDLARDVQAASRTLPREPGDDRARALEGR